jgi:adenine-specific DNA-methyltransferase
LRQIDPPLDMGNDFAMDIASGDDIFTKQRNILEEIAFRDTWGKSADPFIAMIYGRLMLMRDLLAENGSIYVHCACRLCSQSGLCWTRYSQVSSAAKIIWKKDAGGKRCEKDRPALAQNIRQDNRLLKDGE